MVLLNSNPHRNLELSFAGSKIISKNFTISNGLIFSHDNQTQMMELEDFKVTLPEDEISRTFWKYRFLQSYPFARINKSRHHLERRESKDELILPKEALKDTTELVIQIEIGFNIHEFSIDPSFDVVGFHDILFPGDLFAVEKKGAKNCVFTATLNGMDPASAPCGKFVTIKPEKYVLSIVNYGRPFHQIALAREKVFNKY
ncbi:hypothetical protein ROZALSC1DRAFT_27808 [Rozella allomycis CSF55]|uniref:Uncharacterized protein n=1 Tax=Rozella allomycis (strain CSF55) TaxID=988480 RepID=A0A4P9YMH7_ROZAC|nr:hypothetical protein ROZALSC1DRAFT_27808 [Rozella allomycis CSF55]